MTLYYTLTPPNELICAPQQAESARAGVALRTLVYHEILLAYLAYIKQRGFTSMFIWACPPLQARHFLLTGHKNSEFRLLALCRHQAARGTLGLFSALNVASSQALALGRYYMKFSCSC